MNVTGTLFLGPAVLWFPSCFEPSDPGTPLSLEESYQSDSATPTFLRQPCMNSCMWALCRFGSFRQESCADSGWPPCLVASRGLLRSSALLPLHMQSRRMIHSLVPPNNWGAPSKNDLISTQKTGVPSKRTPPCCRLRRPLASFHLAL